ncbi:phosphoribosylamine--glycine ligase, partial [Streptomyces sp. NPDC059409]
MAAVLGIRAWPRPVVVVCATLLVAGVADAVRDAGIPVFGPSKEAAQLEGSKAF